MQNNNDQKNSFGPVYSVRSSTVYRMGADRPVSSVTIIPSQFGWCGESDRAVLQPGQWLDILEHGDPESWSKAVIR